MNYSKLMRVFAVCLLLGSTILQSVPFVNFDPIANSNVVYAADGDNYDLMIAKSLSSVTATNVIYRVDISEVNGEEVGQVVLEDAYGAGLTYSGIVASSQMFSDSGILFINDEFNKKLTREEMILPAGSSEYIELEFTKTSEQEVYYNTGSINACNKHLCEDEYDVVYGDTSFAVQGTYEPPIAENYDLEIGKIVGDCSGNYTSGLPDQTACANNAYTDYELGDEVYFTIRYKNNSTVPVDNIVIADEFDLRLQYDSVTYSSDTGDIPLTDPAYAHFANYNQTNYVFSGDVHNVLSFSNGYSMNPGEEGIVVVKYTIANGFDQGPLQNLASIGVATNLANLGTQFFYGGTYGPALDTVFTGEVTTTNNNDDDEVIMAPFDLSIDKEVISVNGDGSMDENDVDRGDTFVYRLNLYNDGPARTDIAVNDILAGAGDITLESITYSAGMSAGYEPGTDGNVMSGWNVTPGADLISSYAQPSCDDEGNCGEFMRWGNIGLPAGDATTPAGYIDVEISLADPIGCGEDDPFQFENTAFISLTDNRKSVPAWFDIYSPSDWLNMTDDTDETDQTNNADTVSFELLPDQDGSCGVPGPETPTRPYDLSVLKTADKTQVCPGEIVTYTMSVYNSGTMDKFVYLEDEFDAGELTFKEINRDSQTGPGQRYQCYYDTAAYQKMIQGAFDLSRVELLDSSYWFSHNESYDISHYINTVPGCEVMFDTTSPEYIHYTDNLVLVSNAYADQLAIEYANQKVGGADEATAVTSARTLAGDYIANNIATIAPGYDPTFVQAHVAECYEAQFYDRKFFDQGMAPATAATQALDGATRLAQLCTDLTQIDTVEFRSCLQLGAHGAQGLNRLVNYLYAKVSEECPLVDMEVHDNHVGYSQFSCPSGLTRDCEGDNYYTLSTRGLMTPGVPYLFRTFGTEMRGLGYGQSSLTLNASQENLVPKFDEGDRFVRGRSSPAGRDADYETNISNLRQGYEKDLPYLQMTKQEYYDYIGDPTTNCSTSYIKLRAHNTGIASVDANASNSNDRYGYQAYEKAFVCDHPDTGIPNIHFVGPSLFDMVDYRGAETVNIIPTGFEVKGGTSWVDDPDLQFFAPVNEVSIFQYDMIVNNGAAGQMIENISTVKMCSTGSYFNSKTCATATYKPEEVEGDDITPGTDYTGYYNNGGSNNRSSAQIEVLNEPACEAGVSLVKTTAPNTAVIGTPVSYDIEYCNDTATVQNGLEMEMAYPANRDITAGDITGAPAGSVVTIGSSTISFSSFDLAANAGCATVSLTFTPMGPSGDVPITVDMQKLASGVCGDQHCSSASATMSTNAPSVPAPVIQTTKSIIVDGDEPGETVEYQLSYQNKSGAAGNLEVFDYYDPTQLTYVGASVAPVWVDTANGIVYRDEGMLNNNASSTIEVTFEIKSDVDAGTKINNKSEHRLNTTNTCECAIDTDTSNNTDTADTLLSTIAGIVYQDIADNDDYDAGTDIGLQSLLVSLYEEDITGSLVLVATGNTLADGTYFFGDLPAGDYQVSYAPDQNLYPSLAEDSVQPGFLSGSNVQTGTGSNLDPIVILDISLPGGEDSVENDFGLILRADSSLAGTIYLDPENDDVYTGGDTGLEGYLVTLRDSNGSIVMTGVTDASGDYLFENLVDDIYEVSYTTTNNQNNYDYVSDSNIPGTINGNTVGNTNGMTVLENIVLGVDEHSSDNDFGLVELSTIAGTVYYDENNNDTYNDLNDQALEGYEVNLLNASGTVIDTMTTDTSGEYLFTGLLAGTYSVIYTAVGNTNGYEYVTDSNIPGDATPNGTAGTTNTTTTTSDTIENIVIGIAEDSIENNFGLIDPATAQISGTIYFDDEDDDVYTGDQVLEGYEVSLLNASGTVIDTMTTDASGDYLFTDLLAGEYDVVYTVVGNTNNYPYLADSNLPGDATPNGTAGTSDSILTIGGIEIGIGEHSQDNDFGLIDPELSTVSGTIYYDAEDDDAYMGNTGLENFEVSLLSSTGAVIATGVTNSMGYYIFDMLPQGEYIVVYTSPNSNILLPDSNAPGPATPNGASGLGSTTTVLNDTIQNIVIGSDEHSQLNDFGLIDPALSTIEGTVYLDANNSDEYLGDTGLDGYTVTLLDSNGVVVTSQNTNASGGYLFTGLEEGEYSVVYDATSSSYSYVSDSNLPGDTTPDGTAGTTSTTTTLADTIQSIVIGIAEHSVDNDFGLVDLSSIAGTVYFDQNDNDIYTDAIDQALEGYEVSLLDDTGAVIDTIITDASGDYLFEDLLGGTYSVRYTPVGNTNGYGYITDSNIPGPATPSGTVGVGQTSVSKRDTIQNIVIGIDEHSVDNDFGLIGYGSLVGTIYFDQDDSNDYVGENGLAGLVVTLTDSAGNETTTVTNANGEYEFVELLPSTYTVSYLPNTTLYPLYIADSNIPGTIDGTSVGTPVSDVELGSIVLDRAQDAINNDFGLIDPVEATLAGTVYFDDDKDQAYVGDNGLAGYEVELLDADGNVIASMFTDTNGQYMFDELVAGTYSVRYNNTIGAYEPDSNSSGSTGGIPAGVMMLQDISIDREDNSVMNDFGLIPVRKTSNGGSNRVTPPSSVVEEETVFLPKQLSEETLEEVSELEVELTPIEEKIVEKIEVLKTETENKKKGLHDVGEETYLNTKGLDNGSLPNILPRTGGIHIGKLFCS